MFCLWVYALPVIGRILATTALGSGDRLALIVVSGCFALYAVMATTLAFAVPALISRFGAGLIHGLGLLIGAAGIAALGIASGPLSLIPAFGAIAVAWTCMANIPYALAGAAAPEGRGGHVLRVFGFSTVVPQIVVSLCLAIGATWLFGEVVSRVMLVGGAMMAVGGLLTLAYRKRFECADRQTGNGAGLSMTGARRSAERQRRDHRTIK